MYSCAQTQVGLNIISIGYKVDLLIEHYSTCTSSGQKTFSMCQHHIKGQTYIGKSATSPYLDRVQGPVQDLKKGGVQGPVIKKDPLHLK